MWRYLESQCTIVERLLDRPLTYLDSNSRPLGNESPFITTRPLRPYPLGLIPQKFYAIYQQFMHYSNDSTVTLIGKQPVPFPETKYFCLCDKIYLKWGRGNTVSMVWSLTGTFLFIFILSAFQQQYHFQFQQYKLKKAQMVRLGFEPGAVGWQAQRKPRSYGGRPWFYLWVVLFSNKMIIDHFPSHIRKK